MRSKFNGDDARPTPPWSATVRGALVNTPYFSVLLQDVSVTDGSQRTYYTVDFPRPAVGIVACRGDEILLVRQYRFIVDEFVWAIPSGSADADEALVTAAARELSEETGYVADSVEPLLWCYASYGCSNQRFETFVARGLRLTGSFDRNEVIDTRWFTRQEVRELIGQNGVVDSLSLSPLLFVLLENV